MKKYNLWKITATIASFIPRQHVAEQFSNSVTFPLVTKSRDVGDVRAAVFRTSPMILRVPMEREQMQIQSIEKIELESVVIVDLPEL